MNFNVLVAVILIFIFIAAQPSVALFLLGIAYVISGPLMTFRHYKAVKRMKSETPETDVHKSSTA